MFHQTPSTEVPRLPEQDPAEMVIWEDTPPSAGPVRREKPEPQYVTPTNPKRHNTIWVEDFEEAPYPPWSPGAIILPSLPRWKLRDESDLDQDLEYAFEDMLIDDQAPSPPTPPPPEEADPNGVSMYSTIELAKTTLTFRAPSLSVIRTHMAKPEHRQLLSFVRSDYTNNIYKLNVRSVAPGCIVFPEEELPLERDEIEYLAQMLDSARETYHLIQHGQVVATEDDETRVEYMLNMIQDAVNRHIGLHNSKIRDDATLDEKKRLEVSEVHLADLFGIMKLEDGDETRKALSIMVESLSSLAI